METNLRTEHLVGRALHPTPGCGGDSPPSQSSNIAVPHVIRTRAPHCWQSQRATHDLEERCTPCRNLTHQACATCDQPSPGQTGVGLSASPAHNLSTTKRSTTMQHLLPMHARLGSTPLRTHAPCGLPTPAHDLWGKQTSALQVKPPGPSTAPTEHAPRAHHARCAPREHDHAPPRICHEQTHHRRALLTQCPLCPAGSPMASGGLT